jgi:hypothetical protein
MTSISTVIVESPIPTSPPVSTAVVESPIPTSPSVSTAPTGIRFATISDEIFEAGLRSSPGYIGKASTDLVISVGSGQTVEVLGESQIVDGLRWWRVSWNGYIGWVADHTTSGRVILIFNS